MSFGLLAEKFRSSTLRLSLLYAGLLGIAIVGLGLLVHMILAERVHKSIYALTQSQFEMIATAREPHQHTLASTFVESKALRFVYVLVDRSGKALAGDFSMVEPPSAMPFHTTRIFRAGSGQMDVESTRSLIGYGGVLADGSILFVGEDESYLAHFTRELLLSFIIAACGVFVIAVIGGAALSRSILLKINRINKTLQHVSAGNLAARTGTGETDQTWVGDEFDCLARSVDRTLDRTQALMDEIRHVTDDIAHDLRTPLSHLRQTLEHAVRVSASRDELLSVTEGAVERIDGILDTFAAMLNIASVESGRGCDKFCEFDLVDVARAVHEAYLPVAEEQGRSMILLPMSRQTVRGDRQLTLQAVSNLVENALRHTPRGTPITLTCADMRGQPSIIVVDRGAGIPESEHKNVLRRFYRLDKSRTTPGSGLGLALVSAIARAQGATLTLGNAGPGLKAVLQFVSAKDARPPEQQAA